MKTLTANTETQRAQRLAEKNLQNFSASLCALCVSALALAF